MLKKIIRYRVRRAALVIAACLALFAGTIFARYYVLPDARWLWLLAPFVVASLRLHSLLTLLVLVLLFSGLGWQRGSLYMQKLAVYEGLKRQKVTLVGRAAEDAVYGKRYQLTFSADHLQVVEPYQTELTGSIKVAGFGASAVNRGDIVQVSGSLFPTRGNNQASMSFATIQVLQADTSILETIRHKFVAGMQSALPEPAASFGLGILVGQRSTLPEHYSQALLMAGLTHIVAVSGYNLTVIVQIIRRSLSRLSKFQNTVLCIALIGIFLLITGLSPSIVRAGIISLLSIGAWYYGRTIKPMVLLLTAAAITVYANPLYLWGNVSWYLSFLAFFGVLVLAPLLMKRYFKTEPNLFVAILIESFCAGLMTVPYILFIFGETSMVALVANALVVPLIPLAMLFALVAGLAGVFVPTLAGWPAWPAKQLLTYMLDVATLLSRVPHAFVEHITFSCAAMLLSYASIGFICLVLWSKSRPKYGIITDKKQLSTEGA